MAGGGKNVLKLHIPFCVSAFEAWQAYLFVSHAADDLLFVRLCPFPFEPIVNSGLILRWGRLWHVHPWGVSDDLAMNVWHLLHFPPSILHPALPAQSLFAPHTPAVLLSSPLPPPLSAACRHRRIGQEGRAPSVSLVGTHHWSWTAVRVTERQSVRDQALFCRYLPPPTGFVATSRNWLRPRTLTVATQNSRIFNRMDRYTG